MVLSALLASCGGAGEDASVKTTNQEAGRKRALALAAPDQARWSALQTLPLVPASASNLPDGKVLLWSADQKFSFGSSGLTYFAVYDPVTGAVTERTVSETGHDMFCPGTTNLADGRLLVNGGSTAPSTSLFDPATNAWSSGAAMTIPRGYQGNTLLQDGRVLTLGGSWSGGRGNKHGEAWSAATGWTKLSGVTIDSILYADPAGVFRGDNHLALLAAGNGRVFHAGPSANMHWISTRGNGQVQDAGPRGDDTNGMSGSYVMFDTGKILKAGGSPTYDNVNATANSYVIDINSGVTVRKVSPMAYQRAFQNSVVLPNGQVVILGGQTFPVPFSDNTSVLRAELWDPTTETFTLLPAMAAPRNYHSVALLLPDARVMSAGGGLCGAGCAANHPDVQILSPHYLFNADGSAATRPQITAAPSSVQYGQVASITTNSAVTSFAMVRLSSTTHTVNNDQRRLSLNFRATGTNVYAVDIPTNPGWALPGDWMLFAMNADGTPSVAKIFRLSQNGMATITPIDDQVTATGALVSLLPTVATANGVAATFEATGLPAGLAIDAATGRISGTPTQAGNQKVTLTATAGGVRTSTEFQWSVVMPGQTRYVKLEALSEINGNPWTSAAEINLLGVNGQALSRTGWQFSADSQELAGESGGVANAFDGNPATHWHTQYVGAIPVPPHWVVINLGAGTDVTGLRYLPRVGGGNGTIANYRVYLSTDGVNWGSAVASGNMVDLAAGAAEKTVLFNNVARGKAASQSSDYGGAVAARAVDGNIDGAFASGSTTHTNGAANDWWEVDLGTSHALTAVRLWNRSDCCAERLSNFYLLVSDTPMQGRPLTELLADAKVWRSQYAGVAGRSTLLAATDAKGRYVRVQLAGTNFLQLAEVEVHGSPAVNRQPSLNTPAAANGEQGIATQLQLAGADADGDILTYAATGLPPGLTLAPGTGLISGTPTTAGSFAVTATANDGRGGSASVQFTWAVAQAAPQILPVAAAAAPSGTDIAYTAETVATASYTYQWNFGDGTATTGWASVNTASHRFAAPGLYLVTVTARTSDGRASARTFWQAVEGTKGQSGRSSSPLILEPRTNAATRVWAVNPDNDSVSVFDAATKTRIAEVPVGSQPRTLALAPDGRVWVANKAGASISIISPSTLAVVQTVTLPLGSMPYGLVFHPNGTAYVTLEALGQVRAIGATGVLGASSTVGMNVRHLALNAAGTQLLVSRFVTPPLPGEGTANVQTALNGAPKGGEVLVLDANTLAVQRTVVLQHSERPDTEAQGRGIPNYLGAPVIAPDGQTAWVPSKQDNIKRGMLRDAQNLDFQNTVRAISSRLDLASSVDDLAGRIDHDNAGVASAGAFHPGGNYLFVALETSRQVAVVDAIGKRELFRVDTGRAPQGLAVSADGMSLYTHNFMDRSVGVYDLTRLVRFGENSLPLAATMAAVGTERLSAAVLQGKQFFYDARDPRMARDAYISCASCHNDGAQDGRTWDFTGFGEGLRNTISLRGRAAGQGRLHWSGNFDELQDFEGQIRSLAQGQGLMADSLFTAGTRNQPLGDKKAGLSADLDALAAYVASLSTFDRSPNRNANGSLTTAATAGRAVFATQCSSCHSGTDFTDSAAGVLRDVGTMKQPSSGKRLNGTLTGIDTPTLKDAWATAPYLHDGSAATVEAAIGAHRGMTLSATDLANVSAFVKQIDQSEPAVPAAAVNLVATHSSKCLEVNASSKVANALVVQRTCSSANNQKWQKLATTAGNQWRNVNSNLCMAVQNASTAQAAKLVQVACNAAAPSQVFAWAGQNLVVQHTKQCVDIFGAQTADGAQAIQYGCHAGNNQKFTAR